MTFDDPAFIACTRAFSQMLEQAIRENQLRVCELGYPYQSDYRTGYRSLLDSHSKEIERVHWAFELDADGAATIHYRVWREVMP